MTASNPPAASLRNLDVGAFLTVEKLASGGSLQARKLADGSVQFYWRFSHEGRTHREPIGAFDPGAPPKKLEPSRLGYSTAAARERCRQLASQHQQRKHSGGLREVRVEERAAFVERKVAQAERTTRTLARLFETYVGHLRSQGRRSHADAANIFRNHVTEAWPKIAEKPAAEVKAEDVLDILRRLVERGHGRTANKLRAYLRAACQCAIDVRAVATLPVAFRASASERRGTARDDADAPRLFARLPTVMRATGLGRSTIYRLVADGIFPAPVHLGRRAVGWRWSDLARWSESRGSDAP